MQRFYLPTLALTPTLAIREEAFIHQISRVLRSTPGDLVTIFVGDGDEHIYAIETIAKKEIVLVRRETRKNTLDPVRHICLFQALPNKYEKIEWILEKWVEVGISSFVFFPSDRSQKLVLSEKKIARFHEIAREALEQSGGNVFPEIVFREGRGISESKTDRAIVLHTDSIGSVSVSEIWSDRADTSIFVGPEGGWSDAEIAIFRDRWVQIVHLDGRIMRTETAGVVMAFSLLHAL